MPKSKLYTNPPTHLARLVLSSLAASTGFRSSAGLPRGAGVILTDEKQLQYEAHLRTLLQSGGDAAIPNQAQYTKATLHAALAKEQQFLNQPPSAAELEHRLCVKALAKHLEKLDEKIVPQQRLNQLTRASSSPIDTAILQTLRRLHGLANEVKQTSNAAHDAIVLDFAQRFLKRKTRLGRLVAMRADDLRTLCDHINDDNPLEAAGLSITTDIGHPRVAWHFLQRIIRADDQTKVNALVNEYGTLLSLSQFCAHDPLLNTSTTQRFTTFLDHLLRALRRGDTRKDDNGVRHSLITPENIQAAIKKHFVRSLQLSVSEQITSSELLAQVAHACGKNSLSYMRLSTLLEAIPPHLDVDAACAYWLKRLDAIRRHEEALEEYQIALLRAGPDSHTRLEFARRLQAFISRSTAFAGHGDFYRCAQKLLSALRSPTQSGYKTLLQTIFDTPEGRDLAQGMWSDLNCEYRLGARVINDKEDKQAVVWLLPTQDSKDKSHKFYNLSNEQLFKQLETHAKSDTAMGYRRGDQHTFSGTLRIAEKKAQIAFTVVLSQEEPPGVEICVDAANQIHLSKVIQKVLEASLKPCYYMADDRDDVLLPGKFKRLTHNHQHAEFHQRLLTPKVSLEEEAGQDSKVSRKPKNKQRR